jgi:hypothetical protein
VIHIGLVALAAGLIALAGPLLAAVRGRLPAERARTLAAGAALGASPLGAAAFVLAGIGGPRFSCRPDWLAAGPTIAWVALAPILICAAVVAWAAAQRSQY